MQMKGKELCSLLIIKCADGKLEHFKLIVEIIKKK